MDEWGSEKSFLNILNFCLEKEGLFVIYADDGRKRIHTYSQGTT